MKLKTYEIGYVIHQFNLDNSKIMTSSKTHTVGAIDEVNAAFTFGQQFNDNLSYEIYIKTIRELK